MPTSAHKILIHGHQIIPTSVLPIGEMSEEAQEASNKLRNFHEHLARKNTRKNIMEDVFLRLLIQSDPFILNYEKILKKR